MVGEDHNLLSFILENDITKLQYTRSIVNYSIINL